MRDPQATTAALSAPASARELVLCWGDCVQRVALEPSSLLIGRGEACRIQVAHPSVSRTHARLDVADQGTTIEDLGSSNGVKVDGLRISGRANVAIGSLVEVGAVKLVVRATAQGDPPPMNEVQNLVAKLAPSGVSVILTGETGVGKEVLAEKIHVASERRGALVRINCAGLTATLLESELFGYERGAFTGAVASKPGLIEAAEGGTLFLDELGEMPETTQPKLLRVLESREVRRIGSVRAKPVDVRFVSATHRDLRTLAVMGRFREDLLFRLNGYTVRIPPLRERREEIIPLATTFLRGACERANRAAPILSEGAIALLESYRWPGNVRELRNVIERVALLHEGGTTPVLVEHVVIDAAEPAGPLTPRSAPIEAAPSSASSGSSGAQSAPSPSSPTMAPPPTGSAGAEKDLLVQALARAGGNLSAAAKALGVTPRVLGYRMDKLGIPRPRRG